VWKAQSHRGKIVNLAKVGAATIIPFIVSFLPFLLVGGVDQITQILSRLFPFQRGLIHEFWAPNFWALYHFADKLMNIICAKFLLSSSVTFREVSSDLHQLKILPQVTPLCTTIIILLLTVPIIIKLINHNVKFHKLVFICGSLFFMFGFHVHEKAITPYVSLLLVFLTNKEEKEGSYYISSAVFVNIINLLPLLIDSNEKLLRICLPFLWIAIWEHKYQLGSYLDSIIFATGITINMYHELVHPFIRSDRLEFLPLMLNSVFAATFNLCWLIVIYYGQIKSN
jgi:alpha-1,3-glucosyltransferase